MSKKKNRENTGKDKVLALVFTLVFIAGFFMVSYVDGYFSNGISENEIVFLTDNSANFPDILVEDTDSLDNEFKYFTTGVHQKISNKYLSYNRTTVYSGNNTWNMAVNNTQASQILFYQWVIDVPNFDDFVISDINATISKNADSDLRMTWAFYSLDDDTVKDVGETGGTGIFIENNVPTVPIFYNVSIPRETGLNLYDKAQDQVRHILVIQVQDISSDGLGGFTSDIKVSITGQPIAVYNAQNTLSMAIGISLGMNIITAVFMLDMVDYGTIKRDLPKKKRNYGFIPLIGLTIMALSGLASAETLGIPIAGYRIDIIYVVPLSMLLISALGVMYKKINFFIAVIGILLAFGVSYYMAPYYNLVIIPVSNSIWFGYSWGLIEILGAVHIVSWWIMGLVALSNFYLSGGRKLWA